MRKENITVKYENWLTREGTRDEYFNIELLCKVGRVQEKM